MTYNNNNKQFSIPLRQIFTSTVNEPSKKAMGDDALIEFIKASFIEMQENAYIEKVQSGVCVTILFGIYHIL